MRLAGCWHQLCPFHGPPSPWRHQWQLLGARNLDLCLLARSSIGGWCCHWGCAPREHGVLGGSQTYPKGLLSQPRSSLLPWAGGPGRAGAWFWGAGLTYSRGRWGRGWMRSPEGTDSPALVCPHSLPGRSSALSGPLQRGQQQACLPPVPGEPCPGAQFWALTWGRDSS